MSRDDYTEVLRQNAARRRAAQIQEDADSAAAELEEAREEIERLRAGGSPTPASTLRPEAGAGAIRLDLEPAPLTNDQQETFRWLLSIAAKASKVTPGGPAHVDVPDLLEDLATHGLLVVAAPAEGREAPNEDYASPALSLSKSNPDAALSEVEVPDGERAKDADGFVVDASQAPGPLETAGFAAPPPVHGVEGGPRLVAEFGPYDRSEPTPESPVSEPERCPEVSTDSGHRCWKTFAPGRDYHGGGHVFGSEEARDAARARIAAERAPEPPVSLDGGRDGVVSISFDDAGYPMFDGATLRPDLAGATVTLPLPREIAASGPQGSGETRS